jgi:hypothetical protein
LRDFRADSGGPAASAPEAGRPPADTLRADSTEAAAPIGPDTALSTAMRPRPRRPAPQTPASVSIIPHGPVRPGDTLTLTAIVLDGASRPMADAGVAWISREPDRATVDTATGKVRAKASGTARIVAQSGRQTATYELTVLPAVPSLPDTSGYVPLRSELGREESVPVRASVPHPVPHPVPPATPPADDRVAASRAPVDPPLNRRELESRIREGVGRCYDAVRSKNVDRLASLYHPETVADEEKLKRLSRILRTVPWQAAVGKRVDGAREMSARTAAAEFSFRLTWRDAFGGRLFSQPIFRAEFALDGDTWAMSSCRIVGSPKL